MDGHPGERAPADKPGPARQSVERAPALPARYALALGQDRGPDRSEKTPGGIEAIEALPARDRGQQEVVALHVQALRELGKQAASLGRYDEALDHWALALAGCDQVQVSAEIREELVSTCQSRAAAIQSQKRDEAIALLEKGLAIVDDEKLRLTLGELLTSRGIEIFMEAQKTAEREKRGATREILAQFERGLADLDRAAKLGSKRGAEQAAVARKLVDQLKSGFLDIPERAQQLMAAANDAAGREDWDAAANSLREAIQAAGSKAPAAMKKNLAVCLSNRAVEKANRAVEKISQASQGRDRLLQQLFSQLSENSYVEGCALCKKGRYSYGSDSWYTMQLPGGGSATLCSSCVAVVRSATESMPGPPADAVSLLQSALKDLDEAGRLDPSNESVRKHKSDISEVLNKIGGAAVSLPSSGPAAASKRGGQAAARTTDERNIAHSLLVGALAAYVLVAFSLATPGGSGAAWMIRQKQWLYAVREFSTAGKFAYVLLWPLGIFEFVCLITAYAYSVPFAYLAGVICATSWRKKDAFAKLIEVALWVFFFVATYALIVYMRRPH